MAKKKAKQKIDLSTLYNHFRFLVAFDPSLDGTGYAVLDCRFKEPRIAEMGVVKGRTSTWAAETPHQVKLALITAKVKELRSKYDPIFPIVFLERGFTKGNNATQATFKARGALETELVGIHVVEYPPTTVKLATTGYGASSKDEVAEHMANVFRIIVDDFETEDVSDALAVAYTG